RRVETIVNPILNPVILACSLLFTLNQSFRCHAVAPIAPFTHDERQTNAQENRSHDEPNRAKPNPERTGRCSPEVPPANKFGRGWLHGNENTNWPLSSPGSICLLCGLSLQNGFALLPPIH